MFYLSKFIRSIIIRKLWSFDYTTVAMKVKKIKESKGLFALLPAYQEI